MNHHPDFLHFFESVKEKYGYDFCEYDQNFLIKRFTFFRESLGNPDIRDLEKQVLLSRELLIRLIDSIMIPVTELFRDPEAFHEIRKTIIPSLRKLRRFKIWHAGCATGEEVFSLAIMLADEGLLEGATIYATDINRIVLEKARKGVIPTGIVRRDSEKYFRSGGVRSLSDYFTNRFDLSALDQRITERIIFSEHNLVTDASFGEMDLILCRNVLIYFTRTLQYKTLKLFLESLADQGYLFLGNSESLYCSGMSEDFLEINSSRCIYQKKSGASHG